MFRTRITSCLWSAKSLERPLKQQALESLRGHHYKGQGSGQEVGMDAPFGGSQYTINITVAGERYNLIFDTGR